jgi:hypothetical protein
MKAWKVQKVFEDIVYDLRSRGLLPVVILLVVGMVAAPMLITRGSDSSTPSLQPTAGAVEPALENEHAVVSYNPGLRDYKKRLKGLSPKDPFRQQFAQSAETASALSSTVTSPTGGGTTLSGTSPAIGSPIPSTGGGSSGSGGKKKKHKKKSAPAAVSYQVDVLAGDVNATLTPFPNVPSMTPLPSQSTPVVVYFGLSSDNTTALFLVSNKVSNQVGPGTCLPAPDDCALLSLHAGESEDLLYTQDGKIYRIVVAQIKRFTK